MGVNDCVLRWHVCLRRQRLPSDYPGLWILTADPMAKAFVYTFVAHSKLLHSLLRGHQV